MIPDDVRAAIAAANGSLFGIPGDPDRPSFETACATIKSWAEDNLSDDPTEEQDEGGAWMPIYYDPDDPWCSFEDKLRGIVGTELYPYVR